MVIKVYQTIKTENGTVEFKGELSPEEADYVITMGLNYLLQHGALPFKAVSDQDELMNYVPGNFNEQ
jgi:hypothetical protein